MRLYPELTQQEEFDSLRTQGYTGSLNDMQYARLTNVGAYSGSLTDMHKGWANDAYAVDGLRPLLVADFKNQHYRINDVVVTFADMFPAFGAPTIGADGIVVSATPLTIPVANLPSMSSGFTTFMKCKATFADLGSFEEVSLLMLEIDASNYIQHRVSTAGADTGRIQLVHRESANTRSYSSSASYLTPGTLVPISLCGTHPTSGQIKGAIDGVGITGQNITGMPDFSSTNLVIAEIMTGTIEEFSIWVPTISNSSVEKLTS